MNIRDLTDDQRKKFKSLIEMMKDEFGVLPVELEEAIDVVKDASKKSKILDGNFFLEYIMPHKNSYELLFDIYENMKSGLSFERALARCLCVW